MPQTNVTEQIAQLLGVEFPLSLDPERRPFSVAV